MPRWQVKGWALVRATGILKGWLGQSMTPVPGRRRSYLCETARKEEALGSAVPGRHKATGDGHGPEENKGRRTIWTLMLEGNCG